MRYCIILLFFFTLQSWHALGQRAGVRDDTRDAIAVVKPEYPGGEKELQQYLSLNLHYPCDAMARKIEGEIMVSFTITEDGTVSNITSLNKLGYGCEEEAERVIKNMPAWHPGQRNGKAIAINYRLPVVFELPVQPN